MHTVLIHQAKVPSTPHDPSIGVQNGIKKICSNAGIDVAQIEHILHGTTVATNAGRCRRSSS